MKGVILAGGSGTRLSPVTRCINKHLLPVYDRPMIVLAIEALATIGLVDLVIVTAASQVESFRHMLDDGGDYGARSLTFAGQPEPGGVADALRYARPHAEGQQLCVLLGDNIFGDALTAPAAAFAKQQGGARLLLKSVDCPQDFGVAEMRDGCIVALHEKPAAYVGSSAVVGAYFYDADVFEHCDRLTPGPRGEVEITDLNRCYLQQGNLEYDHLVGWWTDAGTFASLHHAGELVRDRGVNGRPPTSPTSAPTSAPTLPSASATSQTPQAPGPRNLNSLGGRP